MLTRWDPFAEIARIQDQFARWAGRESPFVGTFSPAIDIFDEKDAILVKAEVPGIKSEDIKISVDNNVLTVTGERKLEQAEKKEGYHRIEREYGSFSRSFNLPATVDADHVEADMTDGVLTVRVPKKAAPEPKRIEVKTGSGGRQPVKTGKPS
jgi:HSP20 family protein